MVSQSSTQVIVIGHFQIGSNSKASMKGSALGRYSAEALEKGRKSSEEKFLRDVRSKFGEQFDYLLVRYVRQKVPVKIACSKHGVFTQTPDKHLQSTFGCPRCGVDSRASQKLDAGRKRFLRSFKDRYDSNLELVSTYVSVKDRIRFKCKVHDEVFETTPDSINSGKYVCQKCASEARGLSSRLTQDQFLKRAADLFGDKFDLTNVQYVKNTEKVEIGCPIHGGFSIVATSFLSSSHGCPKCGRLHTGYASNRIEKLEQGVIKSKPTKLAVMKVEVFGITAFKLGTTSRNLIDRYALALREILLETTLDELDALKLERYLHGKYFKGRDVRIFLAGLRSGTRWPGDSEIYKEEFVPLILQDIKSAVAAIESSKQDYWQSQPQFHPPILRIRKVRKFAGTFNPPKAVIRLDTKEVYSSASAAARAIGGNQGLVSMVCRGQRGKTKGIKFAFFSDFEAGHLPKFEDMNCGSNHKWARAVRCVDTGKVYQTLSEAAYDTRADSSKITMVCRGHRKSTGGLRWEYVDA